MGLVWDRDVRRAGHVPTRCAPPRPYSKRRHARVLSLAVDVDVVRDVRPPLSCHRSVREVVVHHRGSERMSHDVDLGLARPLLQRGDRIVDLLMDLALVPDRPCGVVVDFVEPLSRVTVAHEAHLLRLELSSRAFDSVHEEDRVLLETRRRVSRRGAHHQRDTGQHRHEVTERPCPIQAHARHKRPPYYGQVVPPGGPADSAVPPRTG
jgi:hypothetical protein